MRTSELLRRRLASSLLTGPKPATAEAVVAHLGAVQAQDPGQSLWAAGSRTADPRRAAVEAEIAAGRLVRTWPMRGTLHLVRPADARWMLAVAAPRARVAAGHRHRQLGLTAADLLRAEDVVPAALAVRPRTRAELFALLDRAGTDTAGQRGVHILGHLAHLGLIAVGARIGRQPGFVLLDSLLIAPAPVKERDEAIADLARLYVRGHGPVTARDLAWWTGLTLADTRRGFAAIRSEVATDGDGEEWSAFPDVPLPPRSDTTMLLAGFDEHVLAYADRSPVLGTVPLETVVPGRNGMFLPTVVRGGRVVGTWKSATGVVAPTAGPLVTAPAWRRFQRFCER